MEILFWIPAIVICIYIWVKRSDKKAERERQDYLQELKSENPSEYRKELRHMKKQEQSRAIAELAHQVYLRDMRKKDALISASKYYDKGKKSRS